MLNWCNRFNICCFLDNHNYHLAHHSVECLAGAGSLHHLSCNAGNALDQLNSFSERHNDWLFGHFSYDLKNEIEHLSSAHPDQVGFPDLSFFVPQIVLQLSGDSISIGTFNNDHDEIWDQISSAVIDDFPSKKGITAISARFTKSEYVETVRKLQKHILRGDCYEINFCQEFYATDAHTDPVHLYQQLAEYSPNPFSAFYKNEKLYALCLSPERYLRKEGEQLISQPIKGTAGRFIDDQQTDQQNARDLSISQKERSENIMIVDLVRNDLSRICIKGSVEVEELCGIYSFPTVHQMISTIRGTLPEDIRWTDIIRATFPMGSMTGAPKKRVMELIEQYEKTKRGLFSGSIGYRNPQGDFDFNVVIRSLLYNSKNGYLSFQAGSAITFNSDPEKEYEECLLKAGAIKKALAETNTFH